MATTTEEDNLLGAILLMIVLISACLLALVAIMKRDIFSLALACDVEVLDFLTAGTGVIMGVGLLLCLGAM